MELTGVDSTGFAPPADSFDALVSGVYVSETNPLTAAARIVLSDAVSNVHAFALSSLPGIIVDVEKYSTARQLPYLPPIEGMEPPTTGGADDAAQSIDANETPAAPAAALPQAAPPLAMAPAVPGETPAFYSDSPAAKATEPSLPAKTPGAEPSVFSEDYDDFPLALAEPIYPAGQPVYDAFAAKDYRAAVSKSWDFFEANAAGGAGRGDELRVLMLAAEARWQFEQNQPTPDLEQALNYYRQVWRRAPEGPVKAFAAFRIGQALGSMGADRQALISLQEALDSGELPFADRILTAIANLELRQGRYENAASILAKSIAEAHDDATRADMLALQADAEFALSNWREALNLYNQALRVDSHVQIRRPLTRYRMGLAAERQNLFQEAAANYAEASVAGAEDNLGREDTRLIQLRIDGFLAKQGYLLSLTPEERAQRAMASIAAAMRDQPKGPIGDAARMAMAKIALAHKAAGKPMAAWQDVPEYADPLAVLESALTEETPAEEAARLGLELIALALDAFDPAERERIGVLISRGFSLAIGESGEQGPESIDEISAQLAAALRADYEAGRYLDGAQLFRAARRFIPKARFPDLCVYYGALCYLNFGAAEEAFIYLKELADYPGRIAIPRDAVEYHLAQAEFIAARNEIRPSSEALGRLEKLLRSYPQTPLRAKVQLLQAQCRAHQNDSAGAAELFSAALASPGLPPEDRIEALLGLGEANAKLGRREQALQNFFAGLYLFEEARAPFEESETAKRLLYGMGEELHRLGDWPKAAMMFEQYLAFYPADPLRHAARYFLADCRLRMGERELGRMGALAAPGDASDSARGQIAQAREQFQALRDDTAAAQYWRDLGEAALLEIDIREKTQSGAGVTPR